MIVTPEAAKGIKCCSPAPGGLCQGPRCMAWRWDTETEGHCGRAGPVEHPELPTAPPSEP